MFGLAHAVLKNKIAFAGSMGKLPRLALMVFQYVAAMVFNTLTVTVHNQLNYMRNVNLGIAVNQTFVFKTPSQTDNNASKLQALQQTLKNFNFVQAVTSSSTVPSRSDAL